MDSDCLICDRIQLIKKNSNPYFVKELETGYVVLGDFQFFHGYSLFLCKQHVSELHFLEPIFKMKFLEEMSIVANAVYNWVNPLKLNYEMLGNSEPHLHWHFFPRHKDDFDPTGPSWLVPKEIRYAAKYKLPEEKLNEYKAQLNSKLLVLLR